MTVEGNKEALQRVYAAMNAHDLAAFAAAFAPGFVSGGARLVQRDAPGEFMGIPATGRATAVGIMEIWRCENGKAAEN